MQISLGMGKNTRSLFINTSVSALVLALLAACGGGGGGSGGVTTGITLSGIAATGAPMAGATVVVKDSTDTEVQACAPCVVAVDGKFSVELKTSAKKPFVLYVKQDGRDEPEVSMIDTATSTTVNVTPITTLIAARLAGDGDPAKLMATGLTSEKIAQAVAEVKSALQPLLTAAGVAADANPLTMTFKADSTGLDKALDALGKVNITRSADGQASVEVEIKMGGSDTADVSPIAPKIRISANSLPVAQGMTEQTLRGALPADNINVKIRDLMQRIQDCYAVAPAERRPNGAKLGSELTAAVCRGLFVGNDPAKYLHNNTVVSQRGAALPPELIGRFTGAFSGIFGTIQGFVLDLPEYRYTITNDNANDAGRPMNGDVVFTARWTVTDPNAGIYRGQTDVSEFQARMEQGELKLVGNQSRHDLAINAQARREEMPAVSAYTYMATGYNIHVSERRWDHDNNRSTATVSIYEQVVVTSPRGQVFTLKPIPGNNYDYLGLIRSSGAPTSIGTVRLNAAYVVAGTALHPSERFFKEFWANPADWTEAAIEAIPSQGNWRFDITFTDAFVAANSASGVVKNLTQYRRAINRAPTLAELESVKWPVLKDPLKSNLSAAAAQQGYLEAGGNGTPAALVLDGWEVPAGAWSPTTAKVYGTGWDEGLDIASTFRKATISCAGTGVHCEKAAGVNTGNFIDAKWGYLQFFGRDSKRLQLSLSYSARRTNADSN